MDRPEQAGLIFVSVQLFIADLGPIGIDDLNWQKTQSRSPSQIETLFYDDYQQALLVLLPLP
jgi:hypothetical protein